MGAKCDFADLNGTDIMKCCDKGEKKTEAKGDIWTLEGEGACRQDSGDWRNGVDTERKYEDTLHNKKYNLTYCKSLCGPGKYFEACTAISFGYKAGRNGVC